jgi:TolB protein
MPIRTRSNALALLAGFCAALPACSTTQTRTSNNTPARPEQPELTDPSKILTISLEDLLGDRPDPFLHGENSDDAWRMVESTGWAEIPPRPAPPRKPDPNRGGPNLAASLYGSMLDTEIPIQSSETDTQTFNARQVTFTGEGSDFDPAVSRDGQFIVFASTQHSPTADIYIKQAGSRVLTRLTTDPGHDVMPAISPDGTRIAFASNRGGNWDIWVMPITGGQAIQVSTDAAHELHPSWSPDGRHIVYSRLGTTSGRWELWVADPYDAMTSQFIGYGMFPEWSPVTGTGVNNADKILFQRSRERGDRTFAVWTLDYHVESNLAGHETQIASDPNLAYINPTWSPDGMWITYAVVPNPQKWIGSGTEALPPNASIWMIGLDGRGEMPLTRGGTVDLMPTWSPNGKVYFVSNRTGKENLWSLDIAPALLTALGGSPFTNGDTRGLAGTIRRENAPANERGSFATVPTDQP